MWKSVELPSGAGDVKISFEKAGDEFPLHTHDEANNHITIVAHGEIQITGDVDITGHVRSAGDVVVWPAGPSHGFKAVTDGAVICNIRIRR
jgi:quercetin dioxygenase-like cupin family protein